MGNMDIEKLNKIRRDILDSKDLCCNPPIMTRAFLSLFELYDKSQKELAESNEALKNAVMDDINFEEMV